MSLRKQPATTADQAIAKPVRQRPFLALFNLLLATTALAVALYGLYTLWQLQRTQQQSAHHALTTLQQQVSELQKEQHAAAQMITTLQQQQQATASELTYNSPQQQTQAWLEQQLSALQFGASHPATQLLALRSLAQAADRAQRLQQPTTALQLLQEGRQQLQQLQNNPESGTDLTPFRQQLQNTMAQLQSRITHQQAQQQQLDSVIAASSQAPLPPAKMQSDSQTAAATTTQFSNFSEFSRQLWADIKNLFRLYRRQDQAIPALTAEQGYFLRESLRLKLESARIALLAGQEAPFYQIMDEAVAWFTDHFDHQSDAGSAYAATLRQLQQASPPAVDTAALLAALDSAVLPPATRGTLPE
ncbi:MAG: uroporphyrinogen-III C-methyltransferase [Gammaproteobacteria bacterium]|nr:uroporphyrinogen-III C-methyltransferase [Gammaproteobacteria bacterium]